MEVDLLPIIAPIADLLLILLGVALTAGATWAIKKFSNKFGISEVDLIIAYVNEMITQGLVIAKQKTYDELQAAEITVKIDNKIVALAADYVIQKAPGHLSKLKIDEAKLIALIESKL